MRATALRIFWPQTRFGSVSLMISLSAVAVAAYFLVGRPYADAAAPMFYVCVVLTRLLVRSTPRAHLRAAWWWPRSRWGNVALAAVFLVHVWTAQGFAVAVAQLPVLYIIIVIGRLGLAAMALFFFRDVDGPAEPLPPLSR